MQAGASAVARSFGPKATCLALVLTLVAGGAVAAQTAPSDADAVDAAVGGTAIRLTAPPGQSLGATALEPIYRLHDVSGEACRLWPCTSPRRPHSSSPAADRRCPLRDCTRH